MPRSKRSAFQNLCRVLNPNGRKIDYGGVQYNRLIRNGYKLEEKCSQLIEDPHFTGDRNAPLPRGRPKGTTRKLSSTETVYNPLTHRNILKSGHLFKELLKKYRYDENKNIFITHVRDPKNEKHHLLINYDDFNKYITKGYIYDPDKNELITPSKKSQVAFGNAFVTYDLNIMSTDDLPVQMKKLNDRIIALLKRSLKKLNSIKFNIRFDRIY